MSKRRTWLINLSVVVGSLLVGLIAAEVGLRLADISYPFPWTFDSARGLALRPGASGVWHDEGVATFRINSDGLRDAEHAVPKPPDVFRIAVLGDSFAEALQVDREKTFWSVLERELAGCPVLSDRRVETLNFGVSGYSTGQSLITLRRTVWRYQPDVVLLAFFTGNDVEDNMPGLSGYARRPYFRLSDGDLVLDDSFSRTSRFRLLRLIWTALVDPLIDHSRLLQLLNETRRKLQASGPRMVATAVAAETGLSGSVFRPPDTPIWDDAWAITEALLLTMREEVESHGAQYWLATLSVGWQVHPDPAFRASAMRDLGVETAFYPERRLDAFARKHGINIITLAEPLQRQAEREGLYLHGFENTGFGDGHWNREGHQRAGKLMADRLCPRLTDR